MQIHSDHFIFLNAERVSTIIGSSQYLVEVSVHEDPIRIQTMTNFAKFFKVRVECSKLLNSHTMGLWVQIGHGEQRCQLYPTEIFFKSSMLHI